MWGSSCAADEVAVGVLHNGELGEVGGAFDLVGGDEVGGVKMSTRHVTGVVIATTTDIFRQHTEVQMTSSRRTTITDGADLLTQHNVLFIRDSDVLKVTIQRVAVPVGRQMTNANLVAPAASRLCMDNMSITGCIDRVITAVIGDVESVVTIPPGTSAVARIRVIWIIGTVTLTVGRTVPLADVVVQKFAFRTDRIDEVADDVLGLRRVDGNEKGHDHSEHHDEKHLKPFHD
ncbi:MAG: hypothetical protein A3I91_05680 [Candidatus Kerfeldbacteria bacterium RIFCSPLOWO2_02_FULL_42_19]|nr:MAG: hypothetical protein A3I91_05680 [Candidatus Kerfeldbacteria bacterium RIFCSPLOWO2_02_FULL_42_19]